MVYKSRGGSCISASDVCSEIIECMNRLHTAGHEIVETKIWTIESNGYTSRQNWMVIYKDLSEF